MKVRQPESSDDIFSVLVGVDSRKFTAMEILVLGDSLPFGRPRYGICRDKTWPYILQRELNAFICMRACGGATSMDVLAEATSLAGYWFGSSQARLFDAVFVQVGIVDAAPRLVSKPLYSYVSKIPGFSRLQRSRRLHQLVGRPWVSSGQFSQVIVKIDKLLGRLSEQVFFVEIAMPDHYLKENVGDFSSLVSDRNLLISSCIGEKRFIRCWGGVNVPQFLLPDGHHLNELGHRLVAQKCLERIS